VVFNILTLAATQPSDLPAYLPDSKSFACSVCHLPHGKSAAPIVLPPTTQPTPGEPLALRNATKPMLRPNVARDTCATCHGSDADRVFLYYHHPDSRNTVKALQDPTGALNLLR
jgi:cytochrome c553